MQDSQESPSRRRAKLSVLIGIILLTVPFYVIGAAALAIAPHDPTPTPTAANIQETAHANTRATESTPIPTLALLPTQVDLPTLPPLEIASATLTPTSTLTPTPTEAILTPLPPTATPEPALPPGLRKHRRHK